MNDRQASICAGDRGGKVLICDGHRYHKRFEMVIQRTKLMYIMKKKFFFLKDKKEKVKQRAAAITGRGNNGNNGSRQQRQ